MSARSVPNIMCRCGRNRITEDAPHHLCIQCLGLQHPYDSCVECTKVNKSTKARRTVQLKAWQATGSYLSRAKSVQYFKSQGQLDSLKADVSGSFSHSASQIIAGNVQGPLIDYGSTVEGLVEHQPQELDTQPDANSSTFSQLYADQSSVVGPVTTNTVANNYSSPVSSHVSSQESTIISALGAMTQSLVQLQQLVSSQTQGSQNLIPVSTASTTVTTSTTLNTVTTVSSGSPVVSISNGTNSVPPPINSGSLPSVIELGSTTQDTD